jgi:hypothetical protein
MTIPSFGTLDDFLSRAAAATHSDGNLPAKPIALLIGSGASTTVPNAQKIVFTIRKALGERDRHPFDEEVSVASGSDEKYQRAFQFAARRRGPEFRDQVIRTAVLKAYRPARERTERFSEKELYQAEIDIDSWDIPDGIASIARIWTGLPAELRGPIITTNFDPIIEIALSRAGGAPVTHVLDNEGVIQGTPRLTDSIHVVHIHGFWREGQTLSMASQLTQDRPSLAGSLEDLLAAHTLWVFGYSGWQDAVTHTLESLLEKRNTRILDILWCSYEKAGELASILESNSMLSRLSETANLQMYAGCDANVWLPQLEADIADALHYSDTSRPKRRKPALIDWSPVDSGTPTLPLEAARRRAVEFLEGREPTVADASNRFIARRAVVPEVINQVKSSHNRKTSSYQVLLGACGEGKSTALLQIARGLATGLPNTSVLYNRDGSLSASEVAAAAEDQSVILILDQAHRSIPELRQLAQVLNSTPTKSVQVILASRDTDWNVFGGRSFSWSKYIKYNTYELRGLDHLDAKSLITTWEEIGPDALGNLLQTPSNGARVDRLLRESKSESRTGGTLFGASLSLRYGDELASHLNDLLERMLDVPILDRTGDEVGSLGEALLYIAVAEHLSGGSTLLNREVLSGIFHLSTSEVDTKILYPLGDEAPVAALSDTVITRHPSIARCLIDKSLSDPQQLEHSVTRIVRAAVSLLEHGRGGHNSEVVRLAYISRDMTNQKLALIAAQAAHEAAPDRLSYQARLSSALRNANRNAEALLASENAVRNSWRSPDKVSTLRFALNELGVTHGVNGSHWENLHFSLMSLADLPDALPMRIDDVDASVHCVGTASLDILRGEASRDALRGVAAALLILTERRGARTDRLKSRLRAALSSHRHPLCDSVDQAVACLQSAADAASRRSEAGTPATLPSTLEFESLRRLLKRG